MKSYQVTVEVTTTYTVEVHAESEQEAVNRAWDLDPREIATQGFEFEWEVTGVEDIEEIQKENEENDIKSLPPEGQREFGGLA